MERLPSEILPNIFIYVSFKDRLKCTLVCHHWYNCLINHSLLYQVEVYSNEGWNRFINMLHHLPHRASQVEILKLKIGSKIDKRILCNLLPNLRDFHYTNNSYTDKYKNHCSKPFKQTNSKSKLEVIKDTSECEVTRQLLMYSSCVRLRRLELDLQYIDIPRKEIPTYLKNAPTLKELILENCQIGIDDCELIHKNVAALDTFLLRNITVVSIEIPRDIIPATSVTKFEMVIADINDYPNYPDWYKYVANKYTKLTHFNYHDKRIFSIEPKKCLRAYIDGLFPIYKTLGIMLPSFVARNFPIELNPFEVIDKYGYQASNISLQDNSTRPIFEQLAVSNLSKSIESLKLYNTALTTPILLQNFTSLKQLHISMATIPRGYNVNLSSILSALPITLTSLNARLLDADITELPSHPNNVETLYIRCKTLSPKLGAAISNYFPRLKDLSLLGSVKENITIDLPDNHFTSLSVKTGFRGNGNHGFVIKNRTEAQTHYYVESEILGDIKFATADDLQNRVVINLGYTSASQLCCDSLKIRSPDSLKLEKE